MSCLLILCSDGETKEQLVKAVRSVTTLPLHSCAHIPGLKEHLLLGQFQILILVVRDQYTLHELMAIREWLLDKKTILIFAGLKKEPLQIAFDLYPSFISHIEDGFDSVALVLEKILKSHHEFRTIPEYRQMYQEDSRVPRVE